jgi:sigma-B regulation protein RsbU (phosphoserine phosphatase)
MAFPILSYSDTEGSHSVVLERPSTSIGRSASQDITLRELTVSRQHAFIEREGDTYTIVDNESTHGTFVNGKRVRRVILRRGDLLQVGSLDGPKLRFHAQEDGDKAGSGVGSHGDLLTQLYKLRPAGPAADPAPLEMERLTWLLRAARQLNEGVVMEEILSALLQLTLQLTGVERGFVFLDENGAMRFGAGLGSDGEALAEDSTISRQAIGTAMASDREFFVSDTTEDSAASEWASVLANKIRSIYCIPLRKRSSADGPAESLGLLYLDSRLHPGAITEVDHQLLDTIATEASALLHNALLAEAEKNSRKAQEELAAAARIHSGLMSGAMPILPYAELRARSVPCSAIGGDFYEIAELKDCVCVAIVDVSGKGLSAAIVAATLQGILHVQSIARQGLADIAASVNQFLCTRNVGKYATMVLLRLYRNGRLEYLNCGHIKPLIVSAVQESEVRCLEESNTVVGLIPGARYETARDTLRRGERLLLMTDGVTEAENSAGEMFMDAGLQAAVLRGELDAILAEAASFHAPYAAQDDCTLVEVVYTGGDEATAT